MKKLFITSLSLLTLLIISCGSDDNGTTEPAPEVPLTFKTNLSDMGIYTGNLYDLIPAENVHLYELNSVLFTDYAHKQRLIRMPEGKAMQYNGSSLLPVFPNNTIITKTFFYYEDENNLNSDKIILETRVMFKTEDSWKIGNYKWNEEMTDATYTDDGSEVAVSYTDINGVTKNINYLIPTRQECIDCHHIYDDIMLIGPKLRNMNFNPNNSATNINQLQHFINQGLLEGLENPSDVSVLANWEDEDNYDIFERGRAYIDINCAHCHLPGGLTPPEFLTDFRLETPFEDTGIYSRRGQIEDRIQSLEPTYMMPKLGRTVVHEEGVEMLLEYLQTIEN